MADEPNVDIVSDLKTDAIPVDQGVPVNEAPAKVEPSTPEPKADKTEEKPLSLRDQISSALKGEKDTPPAAQKDGVSRNPDGTFAPKNADGTAAAPVDPNIPITPPVAVPQGLSPQDADLFGKLPAEMQTRFARTMESLNEKATRYAGYDQLEQLIAPRRQPWALNGMSDVQAINQLLALSDFAAKSPAEFIQYFAQQRGIDLEQVVFGAAPVDPATSAMQKQISDLQSQLTGMTTQQQQSLHNATVDEVVQFASEKSADGSFLRPHFEALGDTILPFIQMVMQQQPSWSRQQILQEAYDRACWSMPDVRAKMQQVDSATRDAARISEQQESARKAKQAGVSIQSGTPSSDNPKALNGSMSLRDTIKAAMAASS